MAIPPQNGFLMNANKQVAYVCNKLKGDMKLAGGFNAIGFLQGGQFLRGYVERCGHTSPPRKAINKRWGPTPRRLRFTPVLGRQPRTLPLDAETYRLLVYDKIIQPIPEDQISQKSMKHKLAIWASKNK